MPSAAASVTARYQIVAASGDLTRDLDVIPWQQLILSRAGWYARNIAVAATVTLPDDLTNLAPLTSARGADGRLVLSARSLETLLDSPVYAARSASGVSLATGDMPVTLTALVAGASPLLIPPERIATLRRMVSQTRRVFGRLALDAAEVSYRPGRAWRPLADDVTYPTFMLRQPVPWRDWQRRRDYYDEGVLL